MIDESDEKREKRIAFREAVREERINRRARIIGMTEGRCWYCGITPEQELLTLDHMFPKSKGGSSGDGNLVPACVYCNSKKGDMLVEEFRQRFHFTEFYGEALAKGARHADTISTDIAARRRRGEASKRENGHDVSLDSGRLPTEGRGRSDRDQDRPAQPGEVQRMAAE